MRASRRAAEERRETSRYGSTYVQSIFSLTSVASLCALFFIPGNVAMSSSRPTSAPDRCRDASRDTPATRARVPFLTADMSICIANASVPTSRGIASRAGLSRRGRHTNATRGAASRVFRVFRAESTSENLCDAAHLSRRAALGVSLSALSALASPSLPLALADASATATFGAVPNERWSAIDATTSVPSSWTTRPGQRVKQSKFMLYTDTYGPNYRYTTALPKFVDGDGAVAANAIQLAVQSRGGQDSIADLGSYRRHRRSPRRSASKPKTSRSPRDGHLEQASAWTARNRRTTSGSCCVPRARTS